MAPTKSGSRVSKNSHFEPGNILGLIGATVLAIGIVLDGDLGLTVRLGLIGLALMIAGGVFTVNEIVENAVRKLTANKPSDD